MSTRKIDGRGTPRRGRGDDGAALVEFVLVSLLLFTLLFGIISFGLVLSFRQDVTRAAAEGARGGAVAFPAGVQTYTDAARTAATSALNDAIKGMGGKFKTAGCDTPGMSCNKPIEVINCPSETQYKCVRVTVTYDYKHFPLYPSIPLIGGLVMPDTIQASSVARING